ITVDSMRCRGIREMMEDESPDSARSAHSNEVGNIGITRQRSSQTGNMIAASYRISESLRPANSVGRGKRARQVPHNNSRIEYALRAGLPLTSGRALRVGGKRINFLCEFIDANHGRFRRITQGDVRFGDLANILRGAGQ